MQLYKLGTNWLGRSFLEKTFRVLVDIKLQMSLQCALALLKASSILGCTSKKTASGLKEIFPFLPLLNRCMSTVSSSELPNTRKALTYWNMFRVGSLGAIRIAEEIRGDVRIVVWGFSFAWRR